MKIIEIKHRYDNSVLFAIEAGSMKLAVEAAISAKTNLSGANLSYANLSYANLSDADLRDADLSDANLSDADLRYADLRYANLRDANLSYADLRYANLRDANLSDANLSDANLSDANLRDANLSYIKNDLWAVLCHQPLEVDGLRAALVEGRVDGSTYAGDCACLVGTIANVAHCGYTELPFLKPDSNRPIEVFFCGIRKGDTPETNTRSKLALEWIDEWRSLIFSRLEPKAVPVEGGVK